MFALLSMDEISRLIQFPSMFKSIDKGIFQKFLHLFPFFNLFSILHSLKYQSDLIDNNQEYNPPVLCNDGLYTWYKMGLLSLDHQKSEIDELQTSTGKEVSTAVERQNNVIDINSKEKIRGIGRIEVVPAKEEVHSSESDENAWVEKVQQDRVVVKSTFYKKSSINLSFGSVTSKVIEEKEDSMELSGFAKFLKGTGRHGIVVPEDMDISKIQLELPEDADSARNLDKAKKDISVEIVETNVAEVVKKKKVKKHKKKEFVNHLVQQSVLDNDLLISEPFAEILYAQGYKEKAIKIYEKLMDKYPEKKINFAAKIDKINKENI